MNEPFLRVPFQFVLFFFLWFFFCLCNTKLCMDVYNLPNNGDKKRLLSFVKQNLMNRYVLLVCTLRNTVRMSAVRLSSNHFAVFSLVSAEFLLYDAFLFHCMEKTLVCRLQQHHLFHSNATDLDYFFCFCVFAVQLTVMPNANINVQTAKFNCATKKIF